MAYVLVAAAVCLHVRDAFHVLGEDLAQADPPAHFTTGVMLYDFLWHPTTAALPFAECFYIKYPKVAFGHWPPVFYVVEALWFVVFGARTMAAQWLCVFITAGFAFALYHRTSEMWGQWQAGAWTAVLLALPIIQHETWRVMSDLLLAACVFLALAAFTDYLINSDRKNAFRFAVWSVLAILTKGTGWLLLIPLTAGPLLTGRTRIYASAAYWTALAGICAAAAPFFLWMSVLGFGYPMRLAGHLHRFAVIWRSRPLAAPAVSLGLITGAVILFRSLPRKALGRAATQCIIFLLWSVGQGLFLLLVPLTPEVARYLIPSIAPLLFLVAGTATAIERQFAVRGLRKGRLVIAAVCAGVVAFGVRINIVSTTAFSRAAAVIPVRETPVVIAVESEAAGEGAFVAKRLELDRYRSSYIVRGSKLFWISDWSALHSTLKLNDPAAVREALDSSGVEFMVVDESARQRRSLNLVDAALQDPAWKWSVIAEIPVSLGDRRGKLVVYHRASSLPVAHLPRSVELDEERGGRTVTCEESGGRSDSRTGARQ